MTEQLERPLGYPQCDWKAGAKQCRYPGSLSSGVLGSGPWYCSGHFGCTDPVMGTDIVEASADYRHPTAEDRARVDLPAHIKAMSREQCRAAVRDGVRKLTARRAA
jgi:hypothetical protein